MPPTTRKRKRGRRGGSKFRTLCLQQEALTAAATDPQALLPTTPSRGALTAATDQDPQALLPTTPLGGALTAAMDQAALLRPTTRALTAAANPEALLPTTLTRGALTAATEQAALLLPTTQTLTAAATDPVAQPLPIPFSTQFFPDSGGSPVSELPVALVVGEDLVGDDTIFSPFSSFSFESDAKEDQDVKEKKENQVTVTNVSDGNETQCLCFHPTNSSYCILCSEKTVLSSKCFHVRHSPRPPHWALLPDYGKRGSWTHPECG